MIYRTQSLTKTFLSGWERLRKRSTKNAFTLGPRSIAKSSPSHSQSINSDEEMLELQYNNSSDALPVLIVGTKLDLCNTSNQLVSQTKGQINLVCYGLTFCWLFRIRRSPPFRFVNCPPGVHFLIRLVCPSFCILFCSFDLFGTHLRWFTTGTTSTSATSHTRLARDTIHARTTASSKYRRAVEEISTLQRGAIECMRSLDGISHSLEIWTTPIVPCRAVPFPRKGKLTKYCLVKTECEELDIIPEFLDMNAIRVFEISVVLTDEFFFSL